MPAFSVIYDQNKIIYFFLEEQEVPYTEKLYINDHNQGTTSNRLAESKSLLWQQNRKLRYYDIEGQDYGELWDTLNMDSYENNNADDFVLRFDDYNLYSNLLLLFVDENGVTYEPSHIYVGRHL